MVTPSSESPSPSAVTLDRPIRHEIEPIRGSRFIVELAPAKTEADARTVLSAARSRDPGASHHCSAWRLAQPAIDRCSDDGEPGGSAGRPMLTQLIGHHAIDVVAVVIRWFGGTKLGVGGLVRAYGGAVAEGLAAADLVPWVRRVQVAITHDYASADEIDRLITSLDGRNDHTDWTDTVRRRVTLPFDAMGELHEGVAEATSGQATVDVDPSA